MAHRDSRATSKVSKCPWEGHGGRWYVRAYHHSGMEYGCECLRHYRTRADAADAADAAEEYRRAQ